MSVYTVHEPPLRAAEASPDPERFVFVRDGFYFWAFLLTPLWMLWHRLWLVLLIYLVVIVGYRKWRCIMPASASVGRSFVALLICVSGRRSRQATLRRFTLDAARLEKMSASSAATDAEAAERRFFDAWVGTEPGGSSGPAVGSAAAPGASRPPRTRPDIVGSVSRTRTRRGERRHRRLRLRQSALGRQGVRARRARCRHRDADRRDRAIRRSSLAADRVVLPGVGAFADCRRGLDAVDGMVEALEEAVHQKGRPFFGICVGMQLLAEPGPRIRSDGGTGLDRRRSGSHHAGRSAVEDSAYGLEYAQRDAAAQAGRRPRALGPTAVTPISCTPTHSRWRNVPIWWRRPNMAARSPRSWRATTSSARNSIPRRARSSVWR